jgi:hypothetical protein
VRSEEEQSLHDHVIELLVERLKQEGAMEIRTNPGGLRQNAIVIEEGKEFYPDVFTLADDEVTAICEVETPSTTHEGSVAQWKDYGEIGATFLLIVPEEEAETAARLLQENEISCQGVLTYQLAPSEND